MVITKALLLENLKENTNFNNFRVGSTQSGGLICSFIESTSAAMMWSEEVRRLAFTEIISTTKLRCYFSFRVIIAQYSELTLAMYSRNITMIQTVVPWIRAWVQGRKYIYQDQALYTETWSQVDVILRLYQPMMRLSP